jgi:hypothetical protein
MRWFGSTPACRKHRMGLEVRRPGMWRIPDLPANGREQPSFADAVEKVADAIRFLRGPIILLVRRCGPSN